ncbi:hypothetical protein Xbed_03747 [Xenorhabdus beddingii]|uniref:Uncharacterized protein n=1 Tax=Xenorhabdus beddingii TaxID=40578 RepID=A0A1Y2S5Z1_9GAMM|nr:hypothetical protein Xbed_03747 [Xenorhabdus beddingii]
MIAPARAIRGLEVGELVLGVPAVAPDLRAEAVTLFGFFHQTPVVIVAIADIPLLHHPPGLLALGELGHRAVGIHRQVLAQVAVGIVAELLFMRTGSLEQGMPYLVVGVVTVTGLPPAAVVNHPHIMGPVVLPAPVDGGRLRREVRVVSGQGFPEKGGGLTGRLVRQQPGRGVAAGKDKTVGTFAYRFPSQCIMLKRQRAVPVKLKVVQAARRVITEVQGVAIHPFTDRPPRQRIPFTGNLPPVDPLTGRQAGGLVISIFHDGIGIGGFHQLMALVVFVGGGGLQHQPAIFRLPAFLFNQ